MAQDFALCLLVLMLPMDASVKLKELQRDAVTRGRKWLDDGLQSLNEQELRSLAFLLSVSLARGDDVKRIVERNNLQWLQHAVQSLSRQNLAAVCKAFDVGQRKDKRKARVDGLCAAFVQGVDSQARGLLKTHRSVCFALRQVICTLRGLFGHP
eukprot:s334_g8.t1